MAALVSGDWTVALVTGLYHNPNIVNGRRVAKHKVTLATAGTYPTGGIPWPTTPSTWDMVRNVDSHIIYESSHANSTVGGGRTYKLSATGNVLRIYEDAATTSDNATAQLPLAEFATTATAGTGALTVLYVETSGW